MDSPRFRVIWTSYQATGPEGVSESWGSKPLTSDLRGSLEEYELWREAEGDLNWWWVGILGLWNIFVEEALGRKEENISDCVTPERNS